MSKQKKIVLAYSGGLDTSVLLSWIKEKHNAEMIAFCADIGQEDELKGLKQKAMKTGASKLYVDDLQAEFARDFIFPMMQASAIYEGQYYLGTSIARPLIAKRMVEIARKEGAEWKIVRIQASIDPIRNPIISALQGYKHWLIGLGALIGGLVIGRLLPRRKSA